MDKKRHLYDVGNLLLGTASSALFFSGVLGFSLGAVALLTPVFMMAATPVFQKLGHSRWNNTVELGVEKGYLIPIEPEMIPPLKSNEKLRDIFNSLNPNSYLDIGSMVTTVAATIDNDKNKRPHVFLGPDMAMKDDSSVEFVLAHELAHLEKNHIQNTAISNFNNLFTRNIMFMSAAMMILPVFGLAPIFSGGAALAAFATVGVRVASSLLSISQRRENEYEADRRAVEITRNPHAAAKVLDSFMGEDPLVRERRIEFEKHFEKLLVHPRTDKRITAIFNHAAKLDEQDKKAGITPAPLPSRPDDRPRPH